MAATFPQLPGIHHVTALAGDPQQNIDFYTGVLGLRLVKVTVNFDDPGSYHLYYGDEKGTPGTILTFFAWPGAPRGRSGTGQLTVTSLAVPEGSLGYWKVRLASHHVSHDEPISRFEEQSLAFRDPDGLQLELVAGAGAAGVRHWAESTVPAAHALRGFHSVTLTEEGFERTAELLTGTLGFRRVAESGNRFRFEAGEGGQASLVDVLCMPDGARGRVAVGSVHHVAFRTPDDRQQISWREILAGLHYNVTPVMDRNYFHSIYFREPGGVLFEIATDPPGFTADEPLDQLGSRLALPKQYEAMREHLQQRLPPLLLPTMRRLP